jgi:hypothetical protein
METYPDMTNLTSLEFCNRHGGDVRGDISSLSKLVLLSQLTLNASPLLVYGDIKVMSKLMKLKSCSLWGPSVHGDIAAFSHLTEIAKLHIEYCSNIEGDISSFSQLTQLNDLRILDCAKIKGLKTSMHP